MGLTQLLNKLGDFFSDNYYLFQIIIAFLLMLNYPADAKFILTGFTLYYSLRCSFTYKKNYFSILLVVYVLYLLATGIAYSYNDRPIEIYFDGLK